MAKRLTDTEKWRDEWFGSLNNDYRIVWLYLVDSCTHAGVWKKDFRGLNFNCNTNFTEAEILEVFGSRLVDRGNFFFIPKFVKFQYSQGLGSNKPVIVSVVKELKNNNLYEIIKKQFGNDYLIIKDKSKDKVKDKSKDESKRIEKPKPIVSEKSKITDLLPAGWDVTEFQELWDGYCQNRIKSKKPLSELAAKINAKELIKYFPVWSDARDRMEKVVKSGWLAFVFDDDKGIQKKQPESEGRYANERKLIFDKA